MSRPRLRAEIARTFVAFAALAVAMTHALTHPHRPAPCAGPKTIARLEPAR